MINVSHTVVDGLKQNNLSGLGICIEWKMKHWQKLHFSGYPQVEEKVLGHRVKYSASAQFIAIS